MLVVGSRINVTLVTLPLDRTLPQPPTLTTPCPDPQGGVCSAPESAIAMLVNAAGVRAGCGSRLAAPSAPVPRPRTHYSALARPS